MRIVVVLVLALGVALAGGAVYMAQETITRAQAERDYLLRERQKSPQLVDVVVVKRPLKFGERFTRDDLEVIKVQAGKVPEGAYQAITVAQGAQNAPRAVFVDAETRPRAALRSFAAFEPILESKVTAPGRDAGIHAALSENMRAFTINVDVASGVSGFLRPGDHVDVYWSGQINGQPVTKLIDTNLRLIAVDQSADADRSETTRIARTVTAEVSPEQVAALTLAQSTGRLTLSLVGMQNTSEIGAIEIDRDQLLGVTAPEVVKVEAAKVCTIRTRKGADVVEVQIPCTN